MLVCVFCVNAVVVFFFLVLFFFQAEDGIRDLVRSRGLGDVYKRQLDNYLDEDGGDPLAWAFGSLGVQDRARHLATLYPVSYTHLTLPTSDLV